MDALYKSFVEGFCCVIKPKPAWFASHRTSHRLGHKLVALEATGSWLKLPGLILEALRG